MDEAISLTDALGIAEKAKRHLAQLPAHVAARESAKLIEQLVAAVTSLADRLRNARSAAIAAATNPSAN